jgi:ABC-2 type transport system ATP-binding protein
VTALAAVAVTRRYRDLVAVDALSVTAEAGTVLALLGPNGAGKTTTVSMLAGTVRPDSGRVLWNAEPADPGSLRRRVGLAPQELQVWPLLTCAEQLELLAGLCGVPRREAVRRTDRLLERLGLAGKRDVQARRLSGGMQRRLNLGLALVGDPPAVVLDEPGAGLDPQSRVLVRDLIAELAADKVVIVTSHDLAEIERLADRIVIVDHGRVIADGTERELQDAHGGGLGVRLTTVPRDLGLLAEGLRPIVGSGLSAAGVVVDARLPAGVSITAALDAATHSGAELRAVHTREPSLEDVFLQLTGRSLRE